MPSLVPSLLVLVDKRVISVDEGIFHQFVWRYFYKREKQTDEQLHYIMLDASHRIGL